MKSPAPIFLLAIILVIIIATATASIAIDSGLVAADGNVKHALHRSNLRKLKHGKGEDVQEDDNVKVRTHGIPPAV